MSANPVHESDDDEKSVKSLSPTTNTDAEIKHEPAPAEQSHEGAHNQGVLPVAAPVTGAQGIVGEPREKAEEAANAFTEHPPTDTHAPDPLDEKRDVATAEDRELAADNSAPAGANGDAEEKIEWPGGMKLALLTFGLCMSIFVVALDNTIIATAIPHITTVFNSLDDVGWYGSSYLLTTTSLQPSFGRIYTFFNVKYTYLFALVLFEVGSILCAAATSSPMLIIGRAVAGAGASALFSGSMTIVAYSVPMAKRPLYISLVSSMFGISSVVGPLLGGALTDQVSWRWCFWINLPFGGLAFVAVMLFFSNPKRERSTMTVKQRILEIDLLGATFLICGIVCLLLALQWGGTTYAWSNSKVWGCILGFGLLIIVFIGLQFRRGDRATIPPRILKQRTVLFSCLFSCFLSMGLYTHIYYLPFYFQAVKGTSAEGSGIRTIPYLVSNILAAIVAGAAITVLGFYKPFMIISGIIFTIGSGLIYTLSVSSSAGPWVGYQLVCGIGAGIGVQIPFIAVQAVLDSKDMPTGNACAIFFNSLGGAIAISIAQNIFSNGLKNEVPVYAPGVDVATVLGAGATQLRSVVPAADLPGVLQAYMIALQQSFVLPIAVGGITALCACGVEWRSVKGKKLMPGGGA